MEYKSSFLILLIWSIGAVQCFISSRCSDPKNLLYLTNYIETGRYAEAKNLALVSHSDMKGVISYAGYLTVDKVYNSNMFFWFFPAKVNPFEAPVVLWLQGGPGASSLYGLFMENGPFFVNTERKLEPRRYSWHIDHNLLYIDNPVGAGFSFTDNDAGYATNEVDVANNLFAAVRQFFILFSELRSNAFYLAGESYAGKYIPALGYAILTNSKSTDPRDQINLQGLSIGNGFTDPVNQLQIGEYLYQLGLIDPNTRDIFNAFQETTIAYIRQGKFVNAFQHISVAMNSNTSVFCNSTGFTSPYNYLVPNGYDPTLELVSEFMLKPDILKALHVGNRTFNAFVPENVVLAHLINDVMDSVADWLAELLDHYKVLIYTGQLDLLVGYPLTENSLQQLKFSAAAEYKVAQRKIWRVDNEVAGYVTQAGKLTRVLVRNAGHMAPADQPKWVYNMLLTMTADKKFT